MAHSAADAQRHATASEGMPRADALDRARDGEIPRAIRQSDVLHQGFAGCCETIEHAPARADTTEAREGKPAGGNPLQHVPGVIDPQEKERHATPLAPL